MSPLPPSHHKPFAVERIVSMQSSMLILLTYYCAALICLYVLYFNAMFNMITQLKVVFSGQSTAEYLIVITENRLVSSSASDVS